MPKKAAHNNKWKRPKSGWAGSVTERKKTNTVKLALLAIGLIFLIIVIGKIVSIIKGFSQPIYSQTKVYRTHIWQKDMNINLIIKSSTYSLLSYNPVDQKVIIIDLPDLLYMNVPGGYGNWKLESIHDLGEAEKDKIGGKLLKQSVAGLFGVPVDGYIVFSGEYSGKKAGEIISDLRDGLWNGFAMTKSITTDLTPKELFDLNLALNRIRFDKIENYDLSKMQVLEETKLPDGTNVFTFDPTRLDSVSRKLVDSNISGENLSVAVYNATDISGLAQKAARIISNIGGNVIVTTTADTKQQKSVIVVKKDLDEVSQNKKTSEVLGAIFTSDCSNNLKCGTIVCEVQQERGLSQKISSNLEECKVINPQVLESRAQINVILGEDFYER